VIFPLPRSLGSFVEGLAKIHSPEVWHAMDWAHLYHYEILVEEMAFRIWPEGHTPYYFQIEPNLRIQPPGAECVPWHSDADFGHQPEEWNIWIPLTEITDVSQALWIEDGPWGKHPIVVNLDEAYVFPGAQWKHGNIANTTDVERRSLDFRLIRQCDFVDQKIRTVEYAMELSVVSYWREP
jgi:hypothetical protein